MNAKIRRLWKVSCLSVLFLPALTRADGLETRYEQTLTVEPLDLLTGTFNLQYERAFPPIYSFYVGLDYLYISPLEQPDSGTQVALGPEFGLRLYLLGRTPAGLWIGPDVGIAWVRNRSGADEYDSVGFSMGGMMGVNVALGHFTGSFGLGSNFYDYSYQSGATRVGLYGVELRERLAVGVVF